MIFKMEKLSVTLIQTSLVWENADANITYFDTLVSSIDKTDVIVLPEMFTTGFTMQPAKNAEPNDGKGLQWMKQKAAQKKCIITGSICVEENKKFYNRLYWIDAAKQQHYNKRHLFRMGSEDQHYTMGNEKISRNKWQLKNNELIADYDVLIYTASWPEVRSYPWKQLLIARAIENQCYVIGVNRIGVDGNGFNHSGDSLVINPLGQIISHTKANEESVETVLLDYEFLTELRKKFPVGLDADSFEIN